MVNSAVINISEQVFEYLALVLLGIYLGVKMLDNKVNLCLTLWGIANLFSHISCTILHSHQQCMRLPDFLHLHQYLLFSIFKIIATLLGYVVVSHCGIDLCFPNDNDIEHFFMCLLTVCISSLEKCLFKSFAHLKKLFVILLLSCKSSLIFWIIDPWFAKVFSYYVGCFFTFLIVFFDVQKF